MSDKITFSADEISNTNTAKDFERARPTPRTGTYFEFEVGTADLKQAKDGYLQVSFKCNALDETGGTMFSQFVNMALPVAFKGKAPGSWARGIARDVLSALVPGVGYSDGLVEDAATGNKVHVKDGRVLSAQEVTDGIKNQAAKTKEIVDDLCNPAKIDDILATYVGRKFFSQVKLNGEYANLTGMTINLPAGQTAVYTRKEAFVKKDA